MIIKRALAPLIAAAVFAAVLFGCAETGPGILSSGSDKTASTVTDVKSAGGKDSPKVTEGSGSLTDVDVYAPPDDADGYGMHGIRFYENGGKTYMIYDDMKSVYEFDGTSFRETGVKTAQSMLFPYGRYGGYAFVAGSQKAAGGKRSGLFKVDLSTGKIGLFTDCKEIVTGAASDGSGIYYTTAETSGVNAELRYADPVSGGSKSLYKWENNIYYNGLRYADGKLYFMKQNEICVFADGKMIDTLSVDEEAVITDFAVEDGIVYVYGYLMETDGSGQTMFTFSVLAYGENGDLLGKVSESHPIAESNDLDKYYVGSNCDRLTVYEGRIVAFDAEGFYLLDVPSGEFEKIAPAFPVVYRLEISKTVYGGKLYLSFGDTVVEYGPDGSKEYKLG